MNSSELATYILQNGTVDAKTLMARLGLKERAMRSRIQHANDSLAGCARIAFSRSHGGYEIAVYDEEALKVRLQDGNRADRLDYLPSTPKERVDYLLHNLLARDSWIKLDDIASMLCVSRATISNDLKDVQRVLDEYGLALEKRPRYGMRVTGEEIDRRNCLAAIAVNTTLSSEHLRPVTSDILERLSASVYKVLECEGVKINPFAHHNLIVYIAVTLSRIREGRVLEAGLTPLDESIARERGVAVALARRIGKEFGVCMPEPEIEGMCIQLASKRLFNTQGGDDGSHLDEPADSTEIDNEAWKLSNEMVETVWRAFRFDFRSDIELIMSLARHLMPLTVRLRYRMTIENAILHDIKKRFPLAYSMAIDASGVLSEHFGPMPSEEEIGYIALLFALAIERKTSGLMRKRVLVVCPNGKGSAQLLALQIRHRFGDQLNSIDTCDVNELDHIDLSKIDYVLTTVALPCTLNVPVVHVSNFLDTKSSEDIRIAINEGGTSEAMRRIPPELFFPHLATRTREDALEFLCARARACMNLSRDFPAAVGQREAMAATSFGNLVALPHAFDDTADHTFAAVGITDNPIDWGGKPVRLIFLICVANDAVNGLNGFYRALSKLLTNKESLQRVVSDMRFETLLEEMKGDYIG